MTDSELIDFFIKNKDFFVQNTLFLDVFRAIGWWLTKGLKFLADACQTLYNYSFGLVDFTTWGPLGEWINSFKPVLIALMAVSIMALGLILIFNHEKKPKLLINLCLGILIVTSSTTVLNMFNTAVISGKDAILGENTFASNAIIASNLTDLLEVDKQLGLADMTPTNVANYRFSELTDSDVQCLSMTDVVNYLNPSITTTEAKDYIFKKALFFAMDDSYLIDVYNGFGWNSDEENDFFNDFYYRYQFNYGTAYLSLISLIIVFIALSYKVVRIIFEIAVSRFLAYMYSAELSGGQKLAKILASIRDSYIVLLLTAVLVKFYLLAQDFISSSESGISDKPLVKGMVLLFLAFAVIDGPNLIEKLTGIDAGLSSGVGKMIAGYHLAKGAVGAAKSTAKAPSNIASGIRGRNLQKAQLSSLKGGSETINSATGGAGTSRAGMNNSTGGGASGNGNTGASYGSDNESSSSSSFGNSSPSEGASYESEDGTNNNNFTSNLGVSPIDAGSKQNSVYEKINSEASTSKNESFNGKSGIASSKSQFKKLNNETDRKSTFKK